MIPILQIGPLAVQFPGLLLLGGVWAATLLIERTARRNKINPDFMTNLVFVSLVVGILGARLGYALRFLDLYLAQPGALLALNANTLSPLEGLIAGLLAALVIVQRKRQPLLPILDALTPGLAVFMLAVGLAHIASGDAFGSPSNVPWAVEIWTARRHPSQIYETIAAALILWAILRLESKPGFTGSPFFSLIALHAAARLILEAFRGDSLLLFETLRGAQVVSLCVLLLALAALGRCARTSSNHA